MDNLESCLPISKPYFLSIEGCGGKKPGADSFEPAGFFPQYQHSVDKKITKQENNITLEEVYSALSRIIHFVKKYDPFLEHQSEEQIRYIKKLADRTHQLSTEGKLTFGEYVILRDSKGHVSYGLKEAK